MRVGRRDPQAMALLFDRLGRRAFGLAYRILGDGAEAEDVVQEAFLALWRQAERLDPERGRLTAFLLTIVHRRAVDALRSRRKRRDRQVPLTAELDAWDSVGVEAAAIANLDGESARRSLERLPAEQRVVLKLFYFDAYRQAEIAAQLDLPIGTVKSRLRLGLEKMREMLQEAQGGGLR